MARFSARRLSRIWGQSVVVETGRARANIPER
jgi:hypothetical protein